MWLFTTDGFISAARWDRPDEYEGEVCLRARERGTLEKARERVDGISEIVVTPTGDYRYRAWCDSSVFADLLTDFALDLDYSNFKSEVMHRQGRSPYEKALHRVWEIMGRLQPRGPYGWGGKGYPRVPKGEKATRRWGRSPLEPEVPVRHDG